MWIRIPMNDSHLPSIIAFCSTLTIPFKYANNFQCAGKVTVNGIIFAKINKRRLPSSDGISNHRIGEDVLQNIITFQLL